MNNSNEDSSCIGCRMDGDYHSGADSAGRIHYTGKELSNPTYHDGQLSPVVGVHNIQLVRANREHPEASNGNGWTYNHQLCWLTGTVSFIISIWQIRQMNMYHLPKRSS